MVRVSTTVHESTWHQLQMLAGHSRDGVAGVIRNAIQEMLERKRSERVEATP
jgi:hypothetical protein